MSRTDEAVSTLESIIGERGDATDTPDSTPRTPKQEPSLRQLRSARRRSRPLLQEHFAPGSHIKTIQTHVDEVTAVDFDAPLSTMATASVSEDIRLWNMASARPLSLLRGHTASVRALKQSDTLLVSASNDATVRVWDLQASSEDNDADTTPCLHVFDSHVGEVTALDFHGDTLVSGAEDRTLRHFDMESGRLVQTLDILWAAAQSTQIDRTLPYEGNVSQAAFVGALQCYDAALATGTSDGLVRLWDLRTGQVHRTLVGHTGPVTALKFDERHLITGSLDRSVRICDLRMGSVFDVFAYESPVSALCIDSRRIATATGEPVVRMYDRVSGSHWTCGGSGVGSATASGSGGQDSFGSLSESPITESIPDAGIISLSCKEAFLVAGRLDGKVSMYSC